MNICRFCNRINKMMDYCLYGTSDDAIINSEIGFCEAALTIFMGFVGAIFMVWWMSPIKYIINKLQLNKITFKCDKK